MRALVFGGGLSGRAAAALLSHAGAEVTLLDGAADFLAGDFSLAVVSPGIALDHPWIAAARARGIPLKSELQLGCEALKAAGVKLLAVTGSKGKSSVVKLVAEALSLAGFRAAAGGNYGVAVSRLALEHECDWVVVEVSSFMLETTELAADTFEAAAILNLQADHLDRHGSLAAYHALKRRLLTMTKRPLTAPAEADGLWRGSYFDNEILRVSGGYAVALLRAAGVGDAVIRRAFAGFRPLPHRLCRVAEIGGVAYFDDSKATSLAALAAGVAMCPGAGKVRLIAGGLPKGDDPESVRPILTKRVKKVYLIGQSAAAWAAAFRGAADLEICGTMERAVAAAKREAVKGEAVLLAPGAASFDQFENFERRGEVFTQLVNKEG